jgi:hypothetical protein
MRSTKLFQLLQGIPEDERKRFALYVASPYFNAVPRHTKLLEIVEQKLLRYKLRNLTEPEAFALLLPGQPYDQNRLRKDCSALVKLLQQYLAQQQYEQATNLQASYLLRGLFLHNLDLFFPSYHQQAEQGLLDAGTSADAHEAHVQIGLARYHYDLLQPNRDSDVDLDALIVHQDLAHFIRKMELCYLQLNNRLVTGKGLLRHDTQFLAQIVKWLPHLPSKTLMYFHLYNCTVDLEQENEFLQFKALLSESALDIDAQEEMYTAALNYCARQLNAGKQNYLRETFDLYMEVLGKQAAGKAPALLSSHFKNIVVVACRLGEFQWAQKFVADFFPHLQGEFNRNAYHFALGFIAFSMGDFAKAESNLYRVLDEYEDIFYGIDARVTLLRTHYETGNVIGLESLADSFRMYIKRSAQLSGQRKANLQAFIRQLRRLAHIPKFDKEAFKKLHAEVVSGRELVNKQWLIAKIEQNLRNF